MPSCVPRVCVCVSVCGTIVHVNVCVRGVLVPSLVLMFACMCVHDVRAHTLCVCVCVCVCACTCV